MPAPLVMGSGLAVSPASMMPPVAYPKHPMLFPPSTTWHPQTIPQVLKGCAFSLQLSAVPGVGPGARGGRQDGQGRHGCRGSTPPAPLPASRPRFVRAPRPWASPGAPGRRGAGACPGAPRPQAGPQQQPGQLLANPSPSRRQSRRQTPSLPRAPPFCATGGLERWLCQ